MDSTLFDKAEEAPGSQSTDLLDAPSLVALMNLPGVGAARAIKLAETFKSWDALLDASPDALKAVARVEVDVVGRPRLIEFREGVRLIGWFDAAYPKSLRRIQNPPAVLWVRGAIPDPARRLAIVGSRATTEWGRSTASYVALGAAANQICVVSGLAMGIDIAAHRATIDAGGTTIAVLGSGVDVPSPEEHLADAKRILDEGGALVSEQPPGMLPSARSLVARNRIQSGLSAATVVIQCTPKSGTMSTARFAFEQGRILAVPIPSDEAERAAATNAGSLSLTREAGGEAISLRSHDDVVSLLLGLVEQ